MASIVSGVIEHIQTNGSSGTTYAIASSAYGYCETAAGTPIKNVDMTGFNLKEGVTVHIKFANANEAANPKLKFNSEADTNAKPIVQANGNAAGTSDETDGWYAGAVLSLTYDGTNWVRDQGFNTTNVDEKVKQTATTSKYTKWRKLLAGYSYSDDAGFSIPSNVTNQAYQVHSIEVKPNDGILKATEFMGDLKSNYIKPQLEKTFNAYTVSANNTNSAVLFLAKVTITNTTTWQAPWGVHYRLYVTTTNTSTQGWYDCFYSVSGDTVNYYNYNNFYNPSYCPIQNHALLYPNSGYSSQGAYLGVALPGAFNVTGLSRTFKIEIYETIGCSVKLLDSIQTYSSLYNSTNYTYHVCNASTLGLQEVGDISNNTIAAGQIRDDGNTEATIKTLEVLNPNLLLLPDGNGINYHPINTSNRNPNTDKNNIYSGSFNITQAIYYYSGESSWSAGSAIQQNSLWLAHSVELQYCFNTGVTLTVGKEVYMVASLTSATTATLRNPQATGSYASASATGQNAGPITQTLPSTADNYIYIYLGRAYTNTTITLSTMHPIYWYKNGELTIYQPISLLSLVGAENLQEIEALSGSDGFLKKVEDSWTLDTSEYVTSSGVTSVSTGVGLTGGDITTTGTIKADLISDTRLTHEAEDAGDLVNRIYPVRADKNGKLAVSIPWTNVNNNYVTSSGITSMTISGTSPVQTQNNLSADGATATATVYLANNYGDTKNPYANKEPHTILAGPTGSTNDAPSFRLLDSSDIPNLNASKIAAGIFDEARIPTIANSKLENDSITVGNVTLSLGGSGTVDQILSSNTAIGKTTSWDITDSGVYQVASSGAFTGAQNPGTDQNAPYTYGELLVVRAKNNGAAQFYISHHASDTKNSAYGIRYRSGWNVVNGSRENGASPWIGWATILDDKNYNLYSPKLDGTGATGNSWAIGITGNAATATEFSSNATVELTGIVTGSNSSKKGWTIATSITNSSITNAMLAGSIANNKLANSSITIAGNNISLGGSISKVDLVDSLGLSKAMRFIGIATVAITDGSTTDPGITNYTTKTAGDVIIDSDSSREYIWSTTGEWELLGGDASYKIVQSPVSTATAENTAETTFVHSVTQNANGEITVKTRPLDTSGTWSGNAVTATTATNLASAPVFSDSDNTITLTVGGQTSTAYTIPYATKTSAANISTTINAVATYTDANGTFGTKASADGALYATSTNGTLQWGTLPVPQGGTGAQSFTANSIIMSGTTTTSALTTRAITNRTATAGALTGVATWSDNDSIPTVNTIKNWDGRYQTNSNSSNLAYCNQGAFGTMATQSANDYVLRSGDTMTGTLTVNGLKGTSDVDYGDALPVTGSEGQLFFQLSEPFYELPVGGQVGQALVKLSNDNRDVTWGDVGGVMVPVTNTKYYVSGSVSNVRNTDNAVFSTSVYVSTTDVLMGAAWNDYAEYRRDNKWEKKKQTPGRCIRETGNGMLVLTNKRLQRGCEIISDTYGFAIGENTEQGYNTPVAVSGRVLAYPYESIDEFKKHIGWPVCSGPNGTVSIMTHYEERTYPSCIIGTISEIPTYEEWGQEHVKVNGRVWIRLR